MSKHERLREWRESQAMSQEQLAGKLGIALRTYWRFEAGGREMKSGALATLAGMGCDIEWLLIGKRRQPTTEFAPGSTSLEPSEDGLTPEFQRVFADFRLITSLNLVERSKVMFEEDAPDQPIGMAFSTAFIETEIQREAEHLLIAYASDSGMAPLIDDSDLVAIDHTDRDIVSRRIYAIRINDRIVIRRLRLDLVGAVTVMADNPDFPPEPLPAPSEGLNVAIVGRVVWHSKRA